MFKDSNDIFRLLILLFVFMILMKNEGPYLFN